MGANAKHPPILTPSPRKTCAAFPLIKQANARPSRIFWIPPTRREPCRAMRCDRRSAEESGYPTMQDRKGAAVHRLKSEEFGSTASPKFGCLPKDVPSRFLSPRSLYMSDNMIQYSGGDGLGNIEIQLVPCAELGYLSPSLR